MTIRFICSCGKHLKARDEMAARRSICPRCGSPVGIPSLDPARPAPMTPLERLRHARNRKPLPGAAPEAPPVAPRPQRHLDPRVVHLLSSPKKRRTDLTGRHLEKHWYECLLYPLRAWRFCLAVGLFLTVLSILAAFLLPGLLAEPPADPLPLALFRLTCILLPVLVVGVPCGFLDCVLASAAAGEIYYIVWSGNPVLTVVLSGARWLTCLLAGPVVFAVTAWLYWLNCGDPGIVDWLILAELGVVSLAYWLYAVLALTDRGRLRDLNPLAVADLGHRLGWRGLGVVVLAAVLLLAHGFLLFVGAALVHTAPVGGFLTLTVGWASGMFWSTFFCRLLGVWCHRTRTPGPL